MATVQEFNKSCTRGVFGSEEDFGELFFIADTTKPWTFLATQTDTFVTTEPLFTAIYIAWLTITDLRASLHAFLVFAFPRTRLLTWSTRFPTLFMACAVDATVFAVSLTGGTILGARFLTGMRTNQGTPAGILTSHVYPSLFTIVAISLACVTTF
jgi:hypothetical protein